MSTTKRQTGIRLHPDAWQAVEARREPGESFAACGERLLLAAARGAADPDPRIVEVTLRSPGGHIDGVVGVYPLSVAAGMIALRRAQGWQASYRIVEPVPKVGAELPDPAAQAAALTIDQIIAARMRDDERRRAAKT